MATALILDAPPTIFDDFVSILDDTEFDCIASSKECVVRGVRRMDTACYDVSIGSTHVHVATERRLGNPTMFVAVMPNRRSFWRRDVSSQRLAERIVELLIAHGAYDPP